MQSQPSKHLPDSNMQHNKSKIPPTGYKIWTIWYSRVTRLCKMSLDTGELISEWYLVPEVWGSLQQVDDVWLTGPVSTFSLAVIYFSVSCGLFYEYLLYIKMFNEKSRRNLTWKNKPKGTETYFLLLKMMCRIGL